jgi:hypothetical protein
MNQIQNNLFVYACGNGELDIIKNIFLQNPRIDISFETERPFRFACGCGYLDVAQWLLQVKPNLDISAKNEESFRWACLGGYLDVAKWLLEIKPNLNISAKNDEAFRKACEYGRLEVAQWLVSLFPEKYIITEITSKIIKYKILHKLILLGEKVVTSVEECLICKENECDVISFCNHSYCSKCIKSWLDSNHSSCPTCRENMNYYSFSTLVVSM